MAAPFSKGKQSAEPKRPGRKPGGRMAAMGIERYRWVRRIGSSQPRCRAAARTAAELLIMSVTRSSGRWICRRVPFGLVHDLPPPLGLTPV